MSFEIEVEVKKTGPYKGTCTCPVDDCNTMLQRTNDGKLRDGVLAHLATVHRIRNRKLIFT